MSAPRPWSLAPIALLIPGLAGCGFTPMYAQPGVSPALAAIDVSAPRGRVGYLLREDLDDELAHDKNGPARWRLDLIVAQNRSPRGLSINDVAQRYVVAVKVRYTLTEIATGRIADTGQVASQVSYDSADQPYAGIAARQDSQERAASDAARQIHLALSVWMVRHAAN